MSNALPIEDRIVQAIRQIVRAVDLHSRKLLGSCGLTGPQLAVLHQVKGLVEGSPSLIARRVHLNPSTVTGILDRLEHKGLVERQRQPKDRRSVRVVMTAAGAELLADSPSLLQQRFCDALVRLEDWEQTQILSTLQRVGMLMGADDLDAAPHLTTGAVDHDGSGEPQSSTDAAGRDHN